MRQDIKLILNPDTCVYDLGIGANGDLISEDGLDTSILVSLMADRRVLSSEVENEFLRRGWVGDLTPKRQGRELGSKVWLYEQSRNITETLSGIEDAAVESLQWMYDDDLTDFIEVSATYAENGTTVNLKITLSYGNQPVNRYFSLWEKTGI